MPPGKSRKEIGEEGERVADWAIAGLGNGVKQGQMIPIHGITISYE